MSESTYNAIQARVEKLNGVTYRYHFVLNGTLWVLIRYVRRASTDLAHPVVVAHGTFDELGAWLSTPFNDTPTAGDYVK